MVSLSIKALRGYRTASLALCLCFAATSLAHAQISVASTVCVEYPSTSTNYVARFGYVNQSGVAVVIPTNSSGNLVGPTAPSNQPGQFQTGAVYNVFSLSLAKNATAFWKLTNYTVTAASFYAAYSSTASPKPVASPLCPIQLMPATLSYTAPGTYTNVFLAQVNSGPGSTGVTLSASSNTVNVAISNLSYVPGDVNSPVNTGSQPNLNPNSIYGTVTVYAGDSTTSQMQLDLQLNGMSIDNALLPVAYSGPAASSTITVPDVTVPAGTASTNLQASIAFTGGQAPSGAVTFSVDGGTPLPATCTGSATPLVCSISLATGSLATGKHTVSVTQAVDATYPAVSGTGALYIQIIPTISWAPATTFTYEGYAVGTGVLDPTSNVPGTFSFSDNIAGATNQTTLLASTILPLGSYTLTAYFSPTDQQTYSPATATTSFQVVPQSLFIFGNSRYVSLLDTGATLGGTGTGGGVGAAVDLTGGVWSITTGGSSIARFTDRGVLQGPYSGLSGASAVAVDGGNFVWIAQTNSIAVWSIGGGIINMANVAAAGNLSSPSAIAIDAAGSVWVANSGNNTVTEVIGAAAPVNAPVINQVIQSSTGARP